MMIIGDIAVFIYTCSCNWWFFNVLVYFFYASVGFTSEILDIILYSFIILLCIIFNILDYYCNIYNYSLFFNHSYIIKS